MSSARVEDRENEAALRAAFEQQRRPAHVRTAALVGCVINAAFTLVDVFAYPEHLALFLSIRVALTALCALIWFRLSETAPQLAQTAFSLGFGAAMLAMIYATGGHESDYFAGLVLVLVGIGVLLPLSVRSAVFVATAIVLPYAATPLFAEGPVEARDFGIKLLFVISGALECVWSCRFLDSLRMKDFRQRRELEQARDHLKEVDRLKSRFSANVHHELRTPLTLMMVPIDTVLSGKLGGFDPAIGEYLSTARSNGLRLARLINNLLDLAKLESRQLALVREPLDLRERMQEIADSTRPMVEQKQIALRTELPEETPRVNADPDAFEKLLLNLLGNALKFTPAGGEIVLALRADEGSGGACVTVRDSGVGIPPDQLEKVFDRFAQVDSSSTRRFEGTGIGLSLCRELVDLHGGRIWAESAGEGQGTAMHFVLPPGEPDAAPAELLSSEEAEDAGEVASANRKSAANAAASELLLEEVERHVDRFTDQERSAEVPDARGDRPKVVLAEDNPDMRRLLQFLLGEVFDVTPTRNGREALEAVRREPPDLVITDAMMPEMSGTELCVAIKQDPALQNVPVMLVTSKAERELKIRGLELGADDYLTKPFHPRELLARANSLVRLSVLSRELSLRNDTLEATLHELEQTQSQLVHREKMASLGQFVAGIAHELNNPLNFLQGNLYHVRRYAAGLQQAVARYEQALADPDRSSAQQIAEVRLEVDLDEVEQEIEGVLNGCEEGLKRSSALVADLRIFSRRDGPSPESCDLHALLDGTLRMFSGSLDDIEVVRELDELPRIECVPGQLHQVFVNLVGNAIDAMEGRGRLVLRSSVPTSGRVRVEVEDEGPGIAPEARDRVFEPFFTTKAPGEGTGLGLSISYGVVTRHGGELTLLPGRRGGSCFRVELPVTVADEADTLAADEARNPG